MKQQQADVSLSHKKNQYIKMKIKIRLTIPVAGKDIVQIEFLHIADRIVNWWNHFGKLLRNLFWNASKTRMDW